MSPDPIRHTESGRSPDTIICPGCLTPQPEGPHFCVNSGAPPFALRRALGLFGGLLVAVYSARLFRVTRNYLRQKKSASETEA